MRNPRLKLADLVPGLERFGSKYEAIDVLADDVLEASSAALVPGLASLDADGRRFLFVSGDDCRYDVEVLGDEGLVRMSRSSSAAPAEMSAAQGLTGGAAARARGSAQVLRGEGAAEEHLVLGLLVGGPLSKGTATDARHVFTMQFETTVGQWRAYSGGLVPWMKEHLLPKLSDDALDFPILDVLRAAPDGKPVHHESVVEALRQRWVVTANEVLGRLRRMEEAGFLLADPQRFSFSLTDKGRQAEPAR